jgi:hypothetical protein
MKSCARTGEFEPVRIHCTRGGIGVSLRSRTAACASNVTEWRPHTPDTLAHATERRLVSSEHPEVLRLLEQLQNAERHKVGAVCSVDRSAPAYARIRRRPEPLTCRIFCIAALIVVVFVVALALFLVVVVRGVFRLLVAAATALNLVVTVALIFIDVFFFVLTSARVHSRGCVRRSVGRSVGGDLSVAVAEQSWRGVCDPDGRRVIETRTRFGSEGWDSD